jgi:hypothetical protein
MPSCSGICGSNLPRFAQHALYGPVGRAIRAPASTIDDRTRCPLILPL